RSPSARPLVCSIRTGREPEYALEHDGEVGLARKPDGERHRTDRLIGSTEEHACALGASPEYILVRRQTAHSPELASEVRGTQSGLARECEQRQVVDEVSLDVVRESSQLAAGPAEGLAKRTVAEHLVSHELEEHGGGEALAVQAPT